MLQQDQERSIRKRKERKERNARILQLKVLTAPCIRTEKEADWQATGWRRAT